MALWRRGSRHQPREIQHMVFVALHDRWRPTPLTGRSPVEQLRVVADRARVADAMPRSVARPAAARDRGARTARARRHGAGLDRLHAIVEDHRRRPTDAPATPRARASAPRRRRRPRRGAEPVAGPRLSRVRRRLDAVATDRDLAPQPLLLRGAPPCLPARADDRARLGGDLAPPVRPVEFPRSACSSSRAQHASLATLAGPADATPMPPGRRVRVRGHADGRGPDRRSDLERLAPARALSRVACSPTSTAVGHLAWHRVSEAGSMSQVPGR